ncbi:haloacid dehalogenase-like hydrolase [Archangium violaceum]|uniref:HAD family hydrolase n=1 Tax=Archangium violaceum TaxID=83451 RepID=UPI00193BA17A|nr:HAD family hydrolase [Archangium violaceum]QRK10924.1 haloacid dehalogenase-like hydrolase [Archangium violaceum]
MARPARWHDTIAVIFDFDDTLAPDSTGTLLRELGVDEEAFWSSQERLVDEGWDPIPAQLFRLVELSRSGRTRGGPITRERLAGVGRELRLFQGVPELFERLRAHARQQPGHARLEFYLLSCGIADIIRHTSIAGEFRALWANELHYDAAGQVDFPRKVISHTEKTRYLFHIAHGLGEGPEAERASEVSRLAPSHELRIPLSQFIYVGDGFTDVPCFTLVEERHGISLGVYKRGARHERKGQRGADARVTGLAPVDYRRGEDLSDSLLLAVGSMCQRIALRERHSPGEPTGG